MSDSNGVIRKVVVIGGTGHFGQRICKRLAKDPQLRLIVTSRAQAEDLDFVSRFFAPKLGVDEDPVTGSAHCLLGPYWEGPLGKSTFMAYQASARGGYVRVTVHDDRVCLGGQAVTVMRGRLV